MDFARTVIAREIRCPPDFAADVHHIEFREDPLTGRRSRLNARRAGRIKHRPSGPVPPDVLGSPEACPFCPDNFDRALTRFDPAFYPGGRIRQGECCLFPNMFPLASHHAAATLCAAHFLDLDGFAPRMVFDCLAAVREFLALVRRHDPDARHAMFHWNHLPPSAASMIHPHVQVLADPRPTAYQETLCSAGLRYHERTGRSFWLDLVDEERARGERYIGENEAVAAIASFSPQGNREVQLIFKRAASLWDLEDGDMAGFAAAIIRLLAGYKKAGVNSFNLSSFSGPAGEKPPYYALHAKLISRPLLQPFYRNDTGILERFHHEADIEVMPEDFAAAARRCWEEGSWTS